MDPLPADASVLEVELSDALVEARAAVEALTGTPSLADAKGMEAELVAMQRAFPEWSKAPRVQRDQIQARIQFLAQRAKGLHRI